MQHLKSPSTIFSLLVVILLFSNLVWGFTEPSSSPPLGNVPAPLNVSNIGQSKSGGLILNTGGAEIGLIIDKGKVCIGSDCRTAWPGEVPSGFVGFFNLGSCPSGWSSFSQAQGRYVIGTPSGGSIGGTQGTALSNLENRPAGDHQHNLMGRFGTFNYGVAVIAGDYTSPVYGGAGNQQNVPTISSGLVSGTPAPYIQLLACQKN